MQHTLKRLCKKTLKSLKKKTPFSDLERHMGLSPGYLSKIDNGRRLPSEMLVKFLIMLDNDFETRYPQLKDFWK